MRIEEIKKKIQYTERDIKIYMGNEIFKDLQCHLKDGSQIAYAYSYLYLTNWLYRNSKYFSGTELIDNNTIREILGYKSSNTTMNFITKKDGLLDKIGYTESTKDYPITSYQDDDGMFVFDTYEDTITRNKYGKVTDYGHLNRPHNMFFLKKPLYAFKRDINTLNDEGEHVIEETYGTYNDVFDTHTIPIEVFMFCMSKKELGIFAFYLYSYVKHRNDIFDGGVDISLENLTKETGINNNTVKKYMRYLKGYRLFEFIHNQEYYVFNMPEGGRKANTYIANDPDFFSNNFMEYEKMEVISLNKYKELKKLEDKANGIETSDKLEFDISQLPY